MRGGLLCLKSALCALRWAHRAVAQTGSSASPGTRRDRSRMRDSFPRCGSALYARDGQHCSTAVRTRNKTLYTLTLRIGISHQKTLCRFNRSPKTYRSMIRKTHKNCGSPRSCTSFVQSISARKITCSAKFSWSHMLALETTEYVQK